MALRILVLLFFSAGFSAGAGLSAQTDPAAQTPPPGSDWQGLLWQYPTGGGLIGAPAAAGDNVYALSEDRHLYALTSAGKFKWKHYLKNLPLGEITLGVDGSLYTGLSNGELAAVNPSGRQIWRFDLGAAAAGGVTVSPEGFLYAGNREGRIYCLDNRGRRRWQADLEAPLADRPVFVPGWGLLCPLENQRLAALDLHGNPRWTALMAGVPGQPLPAEGRIFVPTGGGTVACLSWDGTIVWSRSLAYPVISGPLLSRNGLWAAAAPSGGGSGRASGLIYRLDPASGEPAGKPLEAGPVELFAGDRGIFFLDRTGGLSLITSNAAENGGAGGAGGAGDAGSTGGLGPAEAVPMAKMAPPAETEMVTHFLGSLDSRASGALLQKDGFIIQNCRDWKIKAFGPGEGPAAAGWNQKAGGEARRGISAPPPPEFLPPPGNDEIILRQLAGDPAQSQKLYALEQIREGYNRRVYRGHESWILDILESLAGCGLVDPQYRLGRVSNDFPQVRRQAAQLLAEMGAIRSQGPLEAALLLEWDPSVRRVQALALGRLGSDYSGSVTRALYSTFLKTASINDRRMMADGYLEALSGLIYYYGTVPDSAGYDLLREIYRGDYGRETKNRALSLMGR